MPINHPLYREPRSTPPQTGPFLSHGPDGGFWVPWSVWVARSDPSLVVQLLITKMFGSKRWKYHESGVHYLIVEEHGLTRARPHATMMSFHGV